MVLKKTPPIAVVPRTQVGLFPSMSSHVRLEMRGLDVSFVATRELARKSFLLLELWRRRGWSGFWEDLPHNRLRSPSISYCSLRAALAWTIAPPL